MLVASNELKNFLKNNKELLNNNKFEVLLQKARSENLYDQLRQILIMANIDILPYVDFIPRGYYAHSDITTLKIPKNIKEIHNKAFYRCKELRTIYLPDGMDFFGDDVFSGCVSLESISIPQVQLRGLGVGMFMGCKSLKYVQLPAGIDVVPVSYFMNCISLEDIIVPESVLSININAFRGCVKLREIKLGSALQHINTGAFKDCGSLEEITYNGTPEQWRDIRIKGGNTELFNCTVHTLKGDLRYEDIGGWVEI